jgi:hypothetical protein
VREPFYLLQGRRDIKVVAINTSFQLVPWADMLYACDGKWWDHYKGVLEFTGLTVTYDRDAARKYQLHRIEVAKHGNELLVAG